MTFNLMTQPSENIPMPRLKQQQVDLIYYGIGLLALLVLGVMTISNPAAFEVFTRPSDVLTLVSLIIASAVCNYFPFRASSSVYLALSMLLYLTAVLLYSPVPAALVTVVASVSFELYVSRRGPAYAVRTTGMFVLCSLLARIVYERLGGGTMVGDLSFDIFLPVLGAFVIYRIFNEVILDVTQYLQGYSFASFRKHFFNISGIYLCFVPAAIVLAMLRFSNGPIAFLVGCVLVTFTGFILSWATNSRQKESQQLITVNGLNEQLKHQNQRQLALGNQINQTLDTFLGVVRDYAETSHEQEAAVVQITSTIEELSRTASQIAGAADNVAVAAERAIEAADSGQQAVTATIEAISEVRDKVRDISSKINDLNEKSERIGEIVTVINGIAGEIRLLALNATIEASGAGQFGRRFAIVANEVNQLADRSREALQQIKQIIAEIQTATTTSRRVTEDGLRRMEKSVELATRSEQANQEIIGVVQKTAQAAAAISLATQQQRSASEQVVTNVHDVAVMIGQNAEKVASVSVASIDLQRVARELRAEKIN